MSDIRLTGHTFEPRPLEDPARLVAESIAIAPYLYQAKVRVAAPSDEVGRRVDPAAAVVKPDGAGASLVELGAERLEWIAGYLVEQGWDFEVLEPVELRDYVTALGRRLSEAHGRESVGGGRRRLYPRK
jgi:predicted DNA-binding transcriptional regulator YafY